MKKKPIRVYNVFHLNVWNVSIHWHLIQHTGWTRHFWQLLRQKAVLPISFRWNSTHHTIHSWNIHKHWWLIQRRCIGLIYGHTHSVTYTYGSETKWERERQRRDERRRRKMPPYPNALTYANHWARHRRHVNDCVGAFWLFIPIWICMCVSIESSGRGFHINVC